MDMFHPPDDVGTPVDPEVSLCIYVRMYICIYVCMYVYMYVCIHHICYLSNINTTSSNNQYSILFNKCHTLIN